MRTASDGRRWGVAGCRSRRPRVGLGSNQLCFRLNFVFYIIIIIEIELRFSDEALKLVVRPMSHHVRRVSGAGRCARCNGSNAGLLIPRRYRPPKVCDVPSRIRIPAAQPSATRSNRNFRRCLAEQARNPAQIHQPEHEPRDAEHERSLLEAHEQPDIGYRADRGKNESADHANPAFA